ncbi:hypothetical protein KY290_032959 [Solanum tuberosum]|uniref:PGG domain-containing protein n=1 Tax=Solanum tuberosum TaxID=4113 RepID=A0ABQ7UDH9_SOLTU|nr:hypothetical protein KY290_032959 [Solanum tuberosum]
MNPTLYIAAKQGNTGGGDFLLADDVIRDERNEYQVTPKGNTALYGQSGYLEQSNNITFELLCFTNNKNETALHLAAHKGHTDVVRVLLGVVGGESERNKTLMRMTDDNGDTALHKAVRTGCVHTVTLLVQGDPEFKFPPNNAGETPLYLAAESGSLSCLSEILKYCKTPTHGGPCDGTPLHAAIIQKHMGCVASLLQLDKSLWKESDKWGWNPLHYAAKQGLAGVVCNMVQGDKSLAYTRAGKENDWRTSIHIAASEGYVDVINVVSEQCPDYWEMLNSSGQNALHVAISNKKRRVVRLLLNSKESHNLIDEADNDGNTPLHLLAASKYLHVPLQLIGHPHTKKMLFNKENQTPLDIAESGTETTTMNLRHGRLGRRDFEIKHTKMQEQEVEMESSENKAKSDEKGELEKIMAATEIHLVVATLLVTVTFAAGFTLPGGFESDPSGPYKGLAILARNTAFRAFVVSDAIAFTCSAGAVFSYFFIAANAAATTKLKIMCVLFNTAMLLQLFAMSAVVIAFVTGMYATLAHSVGLAITVAVIGCMSFLVYALLLCAFN